MPYPDELLDSALDLYKVSPETQATLRRAVSAAYYALFHFLIGEACENWARPEQRSALARVFEHKVMADMSARIISRHKNAPNGSVEFRLYSVAYAFSQLQQKRYKADYDLSVTLSAKEVELAVGLAFDAFECWKTIKNEQIAQDYLFSLLFKLRS